MRRLVLVLLVMLVASTADAQQRIKERLLHGAAPGNTPAPEVTLTTPADGATDRSINLSLNYTFTNTCTLATLYLDTVNGQTVFDTDAGCSGSFHPGPLDYETIYHWRVKVENDAGSDTPTAIAFTTVAMGVMSLLTTSDLTCAGMFLAPNMGTGNFSVTYPIAVKVSGASRSYYTVSGNNQTGVKPSIAEFAEPVSLSPCNTAVASIVTSEYTTLWDFPAVAAEGNYVPGVDSYSQIWGLNWDAVHSYLWINWVSGYVNIPPSNSFAAATFNGDHMTLVGCWALNAHSGSVGQSHGGSGVITIPDWFVDAHLTAGRTIGVGMGGRIASGGTSPNSFGPSLEAIPAPAGNPCTANTNTFLSAGTVLARYTGNPSSSGPTCDGNNGYTLGCDNSSRPPTGLQPARMAYATQSMNAYGVDWDPYGGHGWWSSWAGGPGNWYDDGEKTGLVYAMAVSAGWLYQTVLASPAPTVSYPNVTFSITSTSTHDGHHLAAGDVIWVTTCRVGVDTHCVSDNNDDQAFVTVDTVNTSTGAVTGHITECETDDPLTCSGSDHKPVVGGTVKHGVVYAHGGPRPSRQTLRLQIYDPADLAAVADGADADSPVYAEEIDLTTLVPQFGCPGCAIPGIPIYWGQPSSVQVDGANHKLILSFRNAVNARSLVVLFDVAH